MPIGSLPPRSSAAAALCAAMIALVSLAACQSTDKVSTDVARAGELQAGPRPDDSLFGSYLAGRLARAERDVDVAADYFGHALAEDPANQSLLRRTFTLMVADGRMARAIELAGKIQADSESDSMANLVLAIEAIRGRNFAPADVILARTRRSGFVRLLADLLQAWSHAGAGNFDQGLAALDGLKQVDAFAPFRLFHRALILDLAGRDAAAVAAYQATRSTAAANSVALTRAYGSLLERTGRLAEARAVYGIYLDKVTENPGVRAALDRAGNGAEPARYVPDAVAGSAEALYGTASALAKDRVREAAAIYLRLALYLRPDYPIAQTLLADIYELDRRWDRAIEVYRAIDGASPYSWNARIRLAWVLNQLDRKDEAVALLRRMAGERPAETDALVTLADILRGQRRYERAARRYSEAIGRIAEIDERHWALYYARGISLERSKRWPLAEADFLKALELSPEQPLVLNYLGYSWADQGINLERAVEMIERAVALRPSDGYIVDSLGWVLFRLGRYEGAVGHLERAVELRPEDPVINDHLGDAYWRVGRRAEARFQWRRALSYGPEAQRVPVIESKLEAGLAPTYSGDDRVGQGS